MLKIKYMVKGQEFTGEIPADAAEGVEKDGQSSIDALVRDVYARKLYLARLNEIRAQEQGKEAGSGRKGYSVVE